VRTPLFSKQVVRAGALGCLARGSRRAALAKPHPTQTETEAEGSSRSYQTNQRQLSTTDILVPVTMKNAAKCDT